MQLDAFASHQSPLSVILLFVVFVGFSDGIAQGAIFGDVALLPPKYTQVCSPFLSCQTELWITCCMPILAGLLLLVLAAFSYSPHDSFSLVCMQQV